MRVQAKHANLDLAFNMLQVGAACCCLPMYGVHVALPLLVHASLTPHQCVTAQCPCLFMPLWTCTHEALPLRAHASLAPCLCVQRHVALPLLVHALLTPHQCVAAQRPCLFMPL